jgi:hypothetical protein
MINYVYLTLCRTMGLGEICRTGYFGIVMKIFGKHLRYACNIVILYQLFADLTKFAIMKLQLINITTARL